MHMSRGGDLAVPDVCHKSGIIYFSILVFFIILALPVPGLAAYDPPHNAASSVTCAGCHGRTLAIPGGSPFWTDNKADTAYNAICLRCHVTDPALGGSGYSGSSAPFIKSHAHGGTVLKCTFCHNNHEQEQILLGKYDQTNFFIVTGTATLVSYDAGSNTTTITYSSLAATNGSSQWADLSKLAAKTGASRGAMLVPDTNSRSRWPVFLITAINTTDKTITVKGEVTAASSLGIFYGQLMRAMIECDTGLEMVEFFDVTGPKGYTNAGGNGLCQMCHNDPDVGHWTNNGGGQDHYPSRDCMECHSHTDGFVHGGVGGSAACQDCHGHDNGFGGLDYYGTTQTHSRHTEDDADDNGPPLTCDYCHEAVYPYLKAGATGSDVNGDGHIDLSETGICFDCHNQRPSWGGSGCLSCHTGVVNNRADVGGQFAGNSHHVQGVDLYDFHCYQCHWEAYEDGTINENYHTGFAASDAPVDLVISGVMTRPTLYDADGLDGDDTAITFTATNLSGTLAAERQEVAKITEHCLGCHREENNDYVPFGDCRTPRQYAWDSASIDDRYMDTNTATWGKYTGANVADKAITKAYSAHGNAVNNSGGFHVDDGEDGTLTNTRDGLGGTRNYNVECFDCHNSHGSSATGITSSYITFSGYQNGGLLKETQAGKGGYANAYSTSENTDGGSVNPYSQGAGLCFDCHNNSAVGAVNKTGSNTPWGYSDTYGASAPIMGYRDTVKFGQGSRGLNTWTSDNRTPAATILGGHLKASSDLGGYDGVPGNGDEATGTINGLCTPCHDPHGVSPSLGDNRQYGLPLLKGTWLTSPYKEDFPGTVGDGVSNYDHYRKHRGNYFYEGDEQNWKPPAIQKADGRGPGGWRTDRNTFNQSDLSNILNRPVDYNRISEGPEQFAGLCLGCHPKSSLTTDVSVEATTDIAWASLSRIHRSVQGWGWNDGQAEREHSFTCSKCHQPHISGLPRLMKTNCLNYTHRGQVTSGGVPQDATQTADVNDLGRFPFGWWVQGRFPAQTTGICHGVDDANGSVGWPDNQGWNTITPWQP